MGDFTNEKEIRSQTDKAEYYGGNTKYILLDQFSKYINLNPQQPEEDNIQIENYYNNKGFLLPDQHKEITSYTKNNKSNFTYQTSKIFSK